jgi:hypothetical protein
MDKRKRHSLNKDSSYYDKPKTNELETVKTKQTVMMWMSNIICLAVRQRNILV